MVEIWLQIRANIPSSSLINRDDPLQCKEEEKSTKKDPSAPIFSFKKGEKKKPQLFLYKALHPFNKRTYIKPNLSLIIPSFSL